MKKMYNQPKTELTSVETKRMMNDINVSINGSSGEQHPQAGMPKRDEIIE